MVGGSLQAVSTPLREAIEVHTSSLRALLGSVHDDRPASVGAMLEMAQSEASSRIRVVDAETASYEDARIKVIYIAAVLIVTHGTLRESDGKKLVADLGHHAQ